MSRRRPTDEVAVDLLCVALSAAVLLALWTGALGGAVDWWVR